ncbi:MAG: polysaccharide biosynthesis/export family protein [Pseudomonadota bacterium]
MKFVGFPVLVAALLISGCGGTKRLESTASLTVTQMNTLPQPGRADVVAGDRPYLIGPFDKLIVDVFGVEDLSKKVQADASGRIAIPLVGVVEAAGRTPSELAGAIAAGLRPFVKDPQVTVNLDETVSQVITVDGEVKKPGLYPVVGRMTLVRAVATAEGTTEFAQLSDVVLFRTVGGQRYAALYNLKQIRRGVYDDPEVYPNDVVVVGTSEARRLFRDALAVTPAIATPLIYLLR